ncbi:ORF045 [Saltwater crocodilepox virus]|nr:ORF045 [Saltwater crocodilepox virus]QGT49053.1 ORF045 [Saltwater crocodilepox virus]
MEGGTRKKMGPAQLTVIAVLILANCKTSFAIKDTITLEECYADPFYCRNNYWRHKHSKLDSVVEWLGVVIMPPLGGVDIVLGNEERELAAALSEAAQNSAQFEAVGGGGPVIPPPSDAEVVIEVGVQAPDLGVHVPIGGGASHQANFVDVLESIISDFDRGGIQDIDLPPRLKHFIHGLSENGEFFEELAEDADVFTPFPMEGQTEMINGQFPEVPPMHLGRLMNGLLNTYRKFLHTRASFLHLDDQLYERLVQLADNSHVDIFFEEMEDLTQQMKRQINKMKHIMKSRLMKDYVRQVGSGSTFPLPKIPTSLAEQYLAGTDISESISSSSSSDSSLGSDVELDDGVGAANERQGNRESVIKFLPKDPNDPLEGGSKDVFVSGGKQGAGTSKELTQGLEQEPEIPEGKESDYDAYDYETTVKKRKMDSDDDQDFFNAPDQDTDTEAESVQDSEHDNEPHRDTDSAGPSERNLAGDSGVHGVSSEHQIRHPCCSDLSNQQKGKSGSHVRAPPIHSQRRGQHESGLFEHVGGPKSRLARSLFESSIKALST